MDILDINLNGMFNRMLNFYFCLSLKNLKINL